MARSSVFVASAPVQNVVLVSSYVLVAYSSVKPLLIHFMQMAFHKDRQYCGKCGLTYTFQPGTKPPVV